VFRRRKAGRPDAVPPEDDGTDDLQQSEPDEAFEPDVEEVVGYDRRQGPYDLTEVSETGAVLPWVLSGRSDDEDEDEYEDGYEDEYDGDDEVDDGEVGDADRPAAVPRLDLGGLRVALYEGVELRVDVDQESGQVAAVNVVDGASAVQLTAFAAPRREGIWDEVRGEIAGSVSGAGGTVDQVAGEFGDELHAMLPGEVTTGAKGLVPVRFVGVDGPRWFLRGLFTGPAAREPAAAARLEQVMKGCVVVRGDDPMPPGEALALRMPTEIPEGMAAAGPDDQGRPPLAPPQRGPEITEIR
jgi:hypothetical protein